MLGLGQGGATRTVSQTPLDSDPAVTCQAIILEGDLGCNLKRNSPGAERGKLGMLVLRRHER